MTRGIRWAWLAVEFAALFFVAVGVYAAIGSPGSPIPVLVVLAVAVTVYLVRQPDLDRSTFGGLGKLRAELPSMLGWWAASAAVITVLLLIFSPERLLVFPRQEPVVWALVMVLYPLLSVYPQEMIFRAFLFHRYKPLFGTGAPVVAASAISFGFAHVIFGNWVSVGLTLIGGLIFAARYRKTGSVLVASVEHALYGCLVFTIGLGEFVYHGGAG
ncbi:CPBP family intramembrane glutamic endopeptidase [Herbihabitans rhizosphaerae]|uniref:CPBP family intramembrane glutamic endopeptidase n=1 Tax=Herbihabitans rhizosphaerae TaxID=1872711 RepID=UPI001A91C0FB|nr:CPBP family intramembrane glutamic endopeptidase [Herbihabitans rhizosphaerae]